jgi:hypothetical protein
MTPSHDEATLAHRQRRVRRTAGLLVGGAVLATSALAIPALASTEEPEPVTAVAGASTPPGVESTAVATTAPTTTTTTTTPPPPPPTPEEEFASLWASWNAEQQFQFTYWVATPEEKQKILHYLFPPPPPAPKPAPKPAPAARPAAPSQEGHAGPGGYLACVRQHESGGRYNINTGNGYYGAYQFLPSTWNATAQRAGRSDLVGVLPSNASPADQDAMAQALYATNGRQPWAGNGC